MEYTLYLFSPVHLTRSKTCHPAGADSCHPLDGAGGQTAYAVVMKILIADPHPAVQSALHLIAGCIPQVSEVNEAGSLVQLLAQCASSCPDLILFDLALVQPPRPSLQPLADLILVLRCLCPSARLVVISSRFEPQAEILAAGASGLISKTDPPDEVMARLSGFLENGSSH